MTKPIVATPKEEAVKVETPAAETPAEPVVEPVVEKPKTMEDIQKEIVPEVKPKETVGLDKFLKEKSDRKAAEKRIQELEDIIKDGASPKEIATNIDAIAAKYPDVSKDFLEDVAAVITAQVESRADARIEERVKPLEAKETAKKIDDVFQKHFTSTMESMPEFKDIVNPEVIKTLSLDPKNSKKTFKEIIEETYGNALTGKRTIETTVPGGGKDTEPLDFAKARQNAAYFDQVMDNPRLKAEYNERMLKEGF